MFIDKADLELVVLEIHQLQKQINGLISKIKQDKNKIVNF